MGTRSITAAWAPSLSAVALAAVALRCLSLLLPFGTTRVHHRLLIPTPWTAGRLRGSAAITAARVVARTLGRHAHSCARIAPRLIRL